MLFDNAHVPAELSSRGRLRLRLLKQLLTVAPHALDSFAEEDICASSDMENRIETMCLVGLRASFPNDRKTILCVDNTNIWAHFGNLPKLIRDRGHNCIVVSVVSKEAKSPFGETILTIDPYLLAKLRFVDAAICCFRNNPFIFRNPPFPVIGLNHQTTASVNDNPDAIFWLMHFDYYMCNLSKAQRERIPGIFESKLANTRIPEELIGMRRELTLMPAGCPKIDRISSLRMSLPNEEIRKILVCPSAYDLSEYWVGTHGAQLISRLLRDFPDHTIVFRPKPEERSRPEVCAILKTFADHDRFEYDQSADYAERYARGCLMITDTSDTGVTFSLATLRPTLHFLGNDVREAMANWIQTNHPGGIIVRTIDDLVRGVKSILACPDQRKSEITKHKDDFICHSGYSIDRFMDYLDAVAQGRRHSDWFTCGIPGINVRGNTAEDYHECFRSPTISADSHQHSNLFLVQSYLRHDFPDKMPDDVFSRLTCDNGHRSALSCYFELAVRQLQRDPRNRTIQRVFGNILAKICESNIDSLRSHAIASILRLAETKPAPPTADIRKRLSKYARKRLELLAHKEGVKRIAIFGAGEHARWFHQNVRLPWGLSITAIADDDEERQKQRFDGMAVRKPSDVAPSEFDAVVLLPDCEQSLFRDRCMQTWGKNVMTINPYEPLPPDAVPKCATNSIHNDVNDLFPGMAHNYALMNIQLCRHRDGMERIVLFGAGKHTQWLGQILPRWQDLGLTLVSVLDDAPDGKSDPWNVGVLRPNEFNIGLVDAVALSTDCLQDVFLKRCRALWGASTNVVDLYEGFIPGPY